MRRLAVISLTLSLAIGLGAMVLGSSAQGTPTTYHFAVIFDDARGLIGGQLVKIAGAKAGMIEDVVVTPDYKAKIVATINGRFQFHPNATCTIRPEGLIAENYVDCDPGTGTAPLQSVNGTPTVPVTQTTEPVSLLDLFNIFNLPTRERFQVIVNELGIGTAGRGGDFNEILRRANPALTLARQVIGILARQKSQLATIVDATSTIATEGATHPVAIQNFLDRAAALSQLTSNHTSTLSQSIARLPGLLAAAQPALAQLDTVAKNGTPLLANIRQATPALNRVSTHLDKFAAVAKPALADLSSAVKAAIPAVHDVAPLVKTIVSYLNRSRGTTALFAKLSINLQRHGFVESFLSTTYYIASALARFDNTSHLLSILLVGPNNGLCGNYATTPVPGCEAHYGAQTAYKPSHRRAAHRVATHRAKQQTVPTPSATTPTQSTNPLSSITGGVGLPSGAAGAVQQTGQTLQNLVNYLLR